MKKIIFKLFIILFPILSFAQITEGFEGATFPPTTPANWAVLDNGVGTVQSWTTTSAITTPPTVNSGTKAAIIDRENIGAGNTSQDWLVTSQFTVPANGQLRFFTRQGFIGNNGTNFEIRVSTTSQTAQASFTSIKTWTELDLNATYNIYEEKIVSLSAYAGQNVYVAFVKSFTQPTAVTGGDRWIIDDVKVIEQCLDPTLLNANTVNITPTTAPLTWANPGGATSWDVFVTTSATVPGSSTVPSYPAVTTNNPFIATGLTPGTAYQYYVRARCTSGSISQWVGPFNFSTRPAGSICTAPITITGLPYSQTSNINLYGDEFDTPQGAACAGGATNYMAGDEVFYSFTPTFTGNISITVNPTGPSSSLFVYNGCANVGVTCLAGVADATSNPRVIPFLAVTAGQTYVIVISSSLAPSVTGTPFSLVIQQEFCTKPAGLTASNFGTTTADLSWTNPSGATSWQVQIQPAGSGIPTGPGSLTATTNTNFNVTGLTAATQYQYWVRADCGGGNFSSWAGPFLFNTSICEVAQKCNYNFNMTNGAGTGWNGARMEIRQNGIVVQTIGATFTSGSAATVVVPLCETVPFELYWTVAGTNQALVGLNIVSVNFNQTLYTKLPNTGTVSTTVPLYTATFSCTTPACLPTNGLTAINPTTSGATLGWNTAGATAWDIYVVPTGGPAPTATTVPTYANVTTNPFLATGLLQLTTYQYYVRVRCSATQNSTWVVGPSFTTLPTCPKPINLNATAANLTSITLGWTETGTATQWEVFVLPPGSPVPTPGTGTIVNGAPTFNATGLTAATNYIYYVRAICSATDASLISGPFAFRTSICNPANQCNFRFRMRDQGGNSWTGNTISILQNGVLVTTLTGPTVADGTAPVDVTVPLCTNFPFEVFWNAGGTLPGEVSLQVFNQLNANIYNKGVGVGAQNTLLYTGLVECTALPCVRPTGLGANTITTNSANLTWTQPAPAPGVASGWQIVVQDAILGYPLGAGAPTTGSPYAVTGLLSGTTYEFYVRANCGVDGFSNWAGPFKFTTKIGNDECANAINVPVNGVQTTTIPACILTTVGTLVGATASAQATACVGADDDAWYKFTATAAKHYINLLDVVGDPLSHAVYSGTCGALVQLGPCQTAPNSLYTGLTIGQTYYLRIYTSAVGGQNTSFRICIGVVPSPEYSEAVCSDPSNPLVFTSTTGIPNELPTGGYLGALSSNINPYYAFITVLQSGDMVFQISQQTLTIPSQLADVDFVLWGPFTSNAAAVGNLSQGCITNVCANNNSVAGAPPYYPFPGTNIVDSSYSVQAIETATINNAIAGQVYLFLITNFNGSPAQITFTQTNQGQPNAGATDCSLVCSVNLGPDRNVCGVNSVILNSQLTNTAATFKWYRNGVLIPAATASTYSATQSGTYRCVGTCGPNSVEDTMVLNMGPSLIVPDQPDYAICDDASNDGIASFNLASITPNVLLGLNPAFTYNVTYHYNEANAVAGINPINPLVAYLGASQVIYVRVTCVESPSCYTIVLQNLVVKPQPKANLVSSDPDNTICSNETATLTVAPMNFAVTAATYVWTKDGVTITGAITNVYSPTASGLYAVNISLNGCTTTLSQNFTVNTLPNFTLSGTNLIKCVNEQAVLSVVPANFAVTNPSITYTWTLNGSPLANTTSTITVTAYGTYAVEVNNQGCKTIKQVTVLLDTTSIPISANGECLGTNYIITALPVSNSYNPLTVTYQWSDSSGPIAGATQSTLNVSQYVISNNVNPNSFPKTFTVKVTTTPDGCTDKQTFEVLNPLCAIPKGISPNGDGANDSFDLRGLGVKQLTIFNRYGGEVFSQANYTNEWHGQSTKSEALPVGTYYYVIELNNGENKTGWVYINR